jgi:hypothetical protein
MAGFDYKRAAEECRKTAEELRATPGRDCNIVAQAAMWERKAEEYELVILGPPARALLAESFGGERAGVTPDSLPVNMSVELETLEWRRAKAQARVVLRAAGVL